jgi:RNA polymerase sigma-70 factor (ECF subfamily)
MTRWLAKSTDDEDLVIRFQRGETAVFEELYRRHAPMLFGLVRRYLGGGGSGGGSAEDVLQEIFMALFTALPGFRKEARFATWAYRIALNCLARHGGAEPCDALDEEDGKQSSLLAGIPKPTLNLWLEAGLAKLASGYKKVLLLHDLCGFHHDEIALILNISEGASRSQLSRARSALRSAMLAENRKEVAHAG